jgi:hypothetical protein
MALIHDMGEALIGDITPSDGVSRGLMNDPLFFLHLLTYSRTKV